MIKRTIVKFLDGSTKTNVRVMISYRPGPKLPPKQKTIKNFGYLEDYEDQKAFWDEVNKTDSDSKKGHENSTLVIIPKNIKNNCEANKKYNYGYKYLEAIFNELKIQDFFNEITFKGKYSLYDIFTFLVYQRILNPSSKRCSFQEIELFYNKHFDFSLADIYRSLDIFSRISVSLQTYLNEQIKRIIGREKSYAFYDVTNYYFEQDFNGPQGTYQQKGVSKEHRLNPIIQLGLFMDSNNIPIAMKTYPGNTSDTLTLQPAMNDVKKDFNLGRLIVVADKGLNSTKNIDYICNNGDGYVVSQILKGPKGNKYHEKMFDPNGYEGNENFKYKLYEEDFESNINSKKKVTRRRKVLIYWSKEDAAYAKAKRVQKVLKAETDLTNNVYSTSHSNTVGNSYLVTQYLVEETGEVANKEVKGIAYDKVSEDEKYDGYFCIITSELSYDKDKILEVYRNLWHIEESFRITKTDLETRPIYVRTQEHIDGHMLTCFTALTILRLLQYKLGENKISVDRMKKVLNSCNCKLPNDIIVNLDYVGGKYDFIDKEDSNKKVYKSLELNKEKDQIRSDYLKIMNSYNIDLDKMTMSVTEFNRELKKLKFKTKKA